MKTFRSGFDWHSGQFSHRANTRMLFIFSILRQSPNHIEMDTAELSRRTHQARKAAGEGAAVHFEVQSDQRYPCGARSNRLATLSG
jgi:hypothetical protein